jgi:hypothetical protein
MMVENPFKGLVAATEVQRRIVESLGVPFADPFNEEAIIADVNDPKKLGRVKVTTSDGITSQNWVPVSGSSRGTLSARYIGARVLVGKRDGRSENMYVLGVVRNDPEVGVTGNPIQLPIIDESMGVWNNTVADEGMKCNEGNEGRLYILSTEMGQDVVVCLRRTSKQVGSKSAWAWKSLTNGLWVEKGYNPGNETTQAISQSQRNNPGIPACTESLLGEVHEFTEDRGFRTTTMVCRRDENKDFNWMPLSAPPVFFRTTLPKCSEKIHGMEAVVDDGNNSEFMVCQRYQGLMRWVRQGRRIPHKFYGNEKPLSRVQFTTSFNPIKALSEGDYQEVAGERDRERAIDLMLLKGLQRGDYGTGPNIDRQIREIQENLLKNTPGGLPLAAIPDDDYEWAKDQEVAEVVLDTTAANIPLTGTDPRLKALLEGAGLVPATAFDGAQTMRRVASEALRKRTGLPIETITSLIREDLDRDGVLTPATAQALEGVGRTVDVLVNGVADGDIEGALLGIGQTTLRNALLSLEPRAASVMTGLMSGGIIGAVDSAVAIGLDQLPPEVNKYVSPVLGIAKDLLLSSYPKSLENIFSSASGGGLLGAVSSTINGAIGNNIVTPQLLSTVATGLTSGDFGDVSKLFGSLGNLDQIAKLPAPADSLPLLATTALGVAGQVKAMSDLLGKGGIGLDNLDSLIGGGFSAATTIISGVKGLAGLFGGSGSLGCPCDPKCRKTKHGEDSDGNNLVEKCGAMTANNANSATPTGNPLLNNIGPIAEALKMIPTDVGTDLIPKNIRDVSLMIDTVKRVKDMAETVFNTRNSDQVEKQAEDAYTAEAVEKTVKVIDNNITRIESVEKKLIDTVYNFLAAIAYDKKLSGRDPAILPTLIKDVRENAQAIKDLYRFTEKLDKVKDGGTAGVNVTTSIAKSLQNIPDLQALIRLNRKKALELLRNGITPAYKEWKSMDPGFGLSTKLGAYDPPIPDPYGSERTLFNKDRILAISIESKVGDNSPPEDNTTLDLALSPDQLEVLKTFGDGSVKLGESLLNGQDVNLSDLGSDGESTLYDTIVGREGQTDCE